MSGVKCQVLECQCWREAGLVGDHARTCQVFECQVFEGTGAEDGRRWDEGARRWDGGHVCYSSKRFCQSRWVGVFRPDRFYRDPNQSQPMRGHKTLITRLLRKPVRSQRHDHNRTRIFATKTEPRHSSIRDSFVDGFSLSFHDLDLILSQPTQLTALRPPAD